LELEELLQPLGCRHWQLQSIQNLLPGLLMLEITRKMAGFRMGFTKIFFGISPAEIFRTRGISSTEINKKLYFTYRNDFAIDLWDLSKHQTT
jgi:hypothetical protein